jgi:hypothetical protein
MHPHRMDDRGSAKHLWETTGVPTQQARARDAPVALGAGRCGGPAASGGRQSARSDDANGKRGGTTAHTR